MEKTQDLIEQSNWFLKPISNFFLFMFTTSQGYSILLIFFILYILFSVVNALRVRKLAYRAANSGSDRWLPIGDVLYVTGSQFVSIFLKVISNIPVILGVILMLMFLVGFSAEYKAINEYFENEKKITELKIVLKHLNEKNKVADVTILDANKTENLTKLKIDFYNSNGEIADNSSQTIELKGTDIYFDAIVLNFDYSLISDGSKKNIVLPYRVFSDAVPQREGVKLEMTDNNGIPLILSRDSTNVYGISYQKYGERIKEISQWLHNVELARKNGVRSIYGNAVHKKGVTGQKYTIWCEQTGGITIKEEEDF